MSMLNLGVKFLRTVKHQGLKKAMIRAKSVKLLRTYPYATRKLGRLKAIDEIYAEKRMGYSGEVKFSILVPLYNTDETFLREMIESVQMQIYENWELCLCDGSDKEKGDVGKICLEYSSKDNRILYKRLDKNLGISGNTNECIKMATGEYFALLDHDDFLHPRALKVVEAEIKASGADFVYTDEASFDGELDQITIPHFKPDFALDNLRANNYICHLTVFKKELLKLSGLFRDNYDGSQDHDMILRLTENAKCIKHISGIYYFWRVHSASVAADLGAKTYAIHSGVGAVQESLDRNKIKGMVESSKVCPVIYKVNYEILGKPLVSILISPALNSENLKRCITSIIDKTTYDHYEIILLRTQLEEVQLSEKIVNSKKVRISNRIEIKEQSYVRKINQGATEGKGEFLLLLDGNAEVIAGDWIKEMLMYAQRKDVGAVGGKLYYTDNTIWNAGLAIGVGEKGVVAPIYHGEPRESVGYMYRLSYAQNYSALSSGCMMIKREIFCQVGGFDENYKIGYHDVDFCLKLRKLGLLNVFNPYVEMYIHKIKELSQEKVMYNHLANTCSGVYDVKIADYLEEDEKRLLNSWSEALSSGEPYYNRHFYQRNPNYAWDMIEN